MTEVGTMGATGGLSTIRRLLVLESSSARTSWAVCMDGEVLADGAAEGRTSTALFGGLASMPELRTPPDGILVGVGPGSFSGIRVALAAAAGMAAAWRVPVIARRSTDALGHVLQNVSFLGIFADARRGKLFFTAYRNGVLHRSTELIDLGQLEEYLSKCTLAVTTDGVMGVSRQNYPNATDLAAAYYAHPEAEPLPLEPVYLHPALAIPTAAS